MRPLLVPSLAVALLAAACSGGGGVGNGGAPTADPYQFPAAPAVPERELMAGVAEAAEGLMVMAGRGRISEADLEGKGASFAMPSKLVELTFAADRVLCY